jgi:hypothetical protein
LKEKFHTLLTFIHDSIRLKIMNISPDLPSPGQEDKTYIPFHRNLDEKFPITTLLNRQERDSILQGKVEPITWLSLFGNSSLNLEAGIVMGNFVSAAVTVGQWIDIPVIEDGSLEEPRVNLPNGMTIDFGDKWLKFGEATELMEDEQYLKRVQDEDEKTWLAPTEKMVSFIAQRLQQGLNPRK